jgi:hypothetical protein
VERPQETSDLGGCIRTALLRLMGQRQDFSRGVLPCPCVKAVPRGVFIVVSVPPTQPRLTVLAFDVRDVEVTVRIRLSLDVRVRDGRSRVVLSFKRDDNRVGTGYPWTVVFSTHDSDASTDANSRRSLRFGF